MWITLFANVRNRNIDKQPYWLIALFRFLSFRNKDCIPIATAQSCQQLRDSSCTRNHLQYCP